MIRVCPICSNVTIDHLIEKFGEDQVEVGCLGECGEHKGMYFGYVDNDFVIEKTEKAFIEKIMTIK